MAQGQNVSGKVGLYRLQCGKNIALEITPVEIMAIIWNLSLTFGTRSANVEAFSRKIKKLANNEKLRW